MSSAEYIRRQQIRLARLEIVSQMYLRGNTVRKIRAEVMRRLDLPTYSTKTVHSDIQLCLAEWRENRLGNMDDALQVELARIDETVRELWEQWEKSKLDYTKTTRKRKGAPERQNASNGNGDRIRTTSTEENSTNVQGLGNPAYISEIRQQLAERRKLLGLYSADKTQMQIVASDISREELESQLMRLRLITEPAEVPKDADNTQ